VGGIQGADLVVSGILSMKARMPERVMLMKAQEDNGCGMFAGNYVRIG
jgi:hypothetical protein